MKKIRIKLGGEVATAVLLEDKAPKTCEIVWKSLPLEGTINHAKIAGEEFFFIVPLFVDEEENMMSHQDSGNISYWSSRQTICIFYEETPGIGEVSTFARIVENLDGIKREGRKGWVKQGEKIILEMSSG